MEFLNATRYRAAFTLGRAADGKESLVVVVKATFGLPAVSGEPLKLADEQRELVEADEFAGEPGYSALLHEADFAPAKGKCDVLLLGSAYAPGGREMSRMEVALTICGKRKRFGVIGPRVWEQGIPVPKASEPEPFRKLKLGYERAFGGVDVDPKNPGKILAHEGNPVGCGYHPLSHGDGTIGKPLPTQVTLGSDGTDAVTKELAASFGPLGRNFAERCKYAGTYDEDWERLRAPDLPDDFDPGYFQSAPEEQQIEFPKGGEEIRLQGLTPGGELKFSLPEMKVPVEFVASGVEPIEKFAVIDTIEIEPDAGILTMVARSSFPLRRNILEVKQVVVGKMSPAFYRARRTGKAYHSSLAQAIAR